MRGCSDKKLLCVLIDVTQALPLSFLYRILLKEK